MKINRVNLTAAAVSLLVLAGCSANDDNNRGLDYDTLQVNFAGTLTWSEIRHSTEAGLFAICSRDENADYPMASNRRYTLHPGAISRFESAEEPIISEKADHNFRFFAYYPYREGVTSAEALPVEIPAVQLHSEGVEAYTTYVADAHVTTVVPTVNMEFSSVGAVLELNLADDLTEEDGNSRVRSITLKAPEGEALSSPLAVSGTYDLTEGIFTPDASTASDKVTLDFGESGITLSNASTLVSVAVAPFTVPQSGLVAEVLDMDGYTMTATILADYAGQEIKAGDIKSIYLGRTSDGVIPVNFPVEWPLGYENGAYVVSAQTQPLWISDGIWTCPSQTQATIKWVKVSDPSTQYFQKREFVNSSNAIGSVGVKGVWTGDYYEITLPVARFAAGTPLTISFPMYTRQGPVFWDIEYLDGETWKCNKSMVTAYDPNYKMECTFSIIRGQTLVRHTMIFENAVKKGEIKIRIKCADGAVQASADQTCTTRTIPFTDANGYGAPFYFYDKTKEMTSIKISAD